MLKDKYIAKINSTDTYGKNFKTKDKSVYPTEAQLKKQ
jgi:hypothetical protein